MRTLRLNAKGDDVNTWQTFLRDKGFYTGPLDGSFGPDTFDATRAFQRAHQLADDGVVGNQTFAAAMQAGLDLAPEDPPVPSGALSINDAWTAPPLAADATLIQTRDPRVITTHRAGTPCPNNPPPPVGWAYWKGQVPAALGELAKKVEFTPAEFPMGTFVQAQVGGQRVAARVEWHNYQGATNTFGVFRGTSLFHPLPGL